MFKQQKKNHFILKMIQLKKIYNQNWHLLPKIFLQLFLEREREKKEPFLMIVFIFISNLK